MNAIQSLLEIIGEEQQKLPNVRRLANKHAASWLKVKFEVREKLDLPHSHHWHRAALKKRC